MDNPNITIKEYIRLEEEKSHKRGKVYNWETATYEILVYGGNPEAELRVDCYCDAGFKTDRDDIKSQIGHVFVLNGGAVD
ncbi:hypothetical protein Tco_1192683 [Tanacetum coccineum]